MGCCNSKESDARVAPETVPGPRPAPSQPKPETQPAPKPEPQPPKPDPKPKPDEQPDPKPKPDTQPDPKPVPDTRPESPDRREPITVTRVDLNVPSNTRAHYTGEYDVVEKKGLLVIRRGQSFEMDIDFNREFDKVRDDIKLVFKFGKSNSMNAEFNLVDKAKPGEWGATIKSKRGNSVKVNVTPPAVCSVGIWKFNILRHDNGTAVYKHEHPDPVYILFNPWCKDDPVYLKDSGNLKEYVLNETGKIYSGNDMSITAKPWSFGQFEEVVLDCAMFLLDEKFEFSDEDRADPIAVTRRLSALINAPDEGGVLVGKWSGGYAGGTPPLHWSGSVDILDQYYKTKSPVKFGQCWVFSGLTTTLCRTLGIPCRSVTNFSSAHDTDANITIDYLFDEDYRRIKGGDSVWNFHVWNEVWMARADLPAGFGGWQIIDATPQERSGGIFCLGPASAHSIKTGTVELPYDGKFVFAEVNADRLHWRQNADGTKSFMTKYTDTIGLKISTKAVGSSTREDITRQYKHKEGSKEERMAVHTAYRSTDHEEMTSEVYDSKKADVRIDVITDWNTFMGQDVEITLEMKNESNERRVISGNLIVSTMFYTGIIHKDIQKETISEVLEPNEAKSVKVRVDEPTYLNELMDHSKSVKVKVDETTYLNELMDHCNLNISCQCLVKETDQPFVYIRELRLRKPHLDIQAPARVKRYDKVDVKVSFTNPLGVTLTDCELGIEGPGLQRPMILKQGNVEAKGEFEASFEITPFKSGNRDLIVSFNCTQIHNVNASKEMVVQ